MIFIRCYYLVSIIKQKLKVKIFFWLVGCMEKCVSKAYFKGLQSSSIVLLISIYQDYLKILWVESKTIFCKKN